MYKLRINTRDNRLIIRKKTAKIKVGASVKRGLKGETGTTDYNELINKPDLTLKADKTYVDTQDTALQDAIDTKQPTGDYATNTALTSGLATKADTTALTAHTSNTANPHSVTKAQVGLGDVANLAPADMPVSTATQTALNSKVTGVGRIYIQSAAPTSPTEGDLWVDLS